MKVITMLVEKTKNLNVNALDPNNQMNWKDAAIISLILTFAQFFTVFMPSWSWTGAVADPYTFVWALTQFLGGAFFTQFITLSGIAYLARKKEPT